MTIDMKWLGLILLSAATAMMAFGTADARADKPAKFTAEEYPAFMDAKIPLANEGAEEEEIEGAEEPAELKHVFTYGAGRTVACTAGEFNGEIGEATEEALFSIAYSECSSSLGPATVDANGCGFAFKATADIIDGKHTYTALTAVKCPEEQGIELDLYSSGSNHESGNATCTYEVGEQSDLATTDLTNRKGGSQRTPDDWIKGHVNMSDVTASRTMGSALICGPSHVSTATLAGPTEIKGTNSKDGKIGITVSTVE